MYTDSLVDIIAVIGPTAVGKTALGAKLAYEFNGEIISADSRQVYKKMDLGTGKDFSDYNVNGNLIPYWLIDIAEPSEEYNLFRFTQDFYNCYDQIKERKKLPFLVGGTGLYLSAVLQNYTLNRVAEDEEYKTELFSMPDEQLREILLSYKPFQHNSTDLLERDRIIQAIIVARYDSSSAAPRKQLNSFILGINPERNQVRRRITERLKHRLQNGMIEEVRNLIDEGLSMERLNLFGLEYRYVSLYLQGKLNYNDMYQKLNSAIHAFAKRQMTWFRKMEREGTKIQWIENADFELAKSLINEHCFEKPAVK